jgi:hypothetical protein
MPRSNYNRNRTPDEILAELHKEGEEAFLDNMLPSDCPYPKFSLKYSRWMRGFHNAQLGALLVEISELNESNDSDL